MFQGHVVTCRNFILTSQFGQVPTFFSSSDSLLSEVDVDDDDEEWRLKENKQNLLISSLVTCAISSKNFLMTEKINRKEKYLTCFSKAVFCLILL